MNAIVYVTPFFFNDTATTEIYTLSLHDALPISAASVASETSTSSRPSEQSGATSGASEALSQTTGPRPAGRARAEPRSEEHTSELQSRLHLVCRLLLEKKKAKHSTLSLSRHMRS